MKLVKINSVVILLSMCISGCGTTHAQRMAFYHERIHHTHAVGKAIVTKAGPLVTTGTCVMAPEYCELAKIALRGANMTINSIEAIHNDNDGTRLDTLAQEFNKDISTVNQILVVTGQKPIDLQEFNDTLKDIK